MILNRETDYAVRIVACLSENTRMDAKSIAAACGVTPKFTLKILSKLCAGGITKSYKGANGGYVLNKPPSEITLLEVVEEIYGSLRLGSCEEKNCTHPEGFCRFRETFEGISDYMRDTLSKVTF